jgi:hypothetical protein
MPPFLTPWLSGDWNKNLLGESMRARRLFSVRPLAGALFGACASQAGEQMT